MQGNLNQRLDLARLLVNRLERLSVDSYWAHRASGLRGSLLKALEQLETHSQPERPEEKGGELERLDELVTRGFEILEKAAREIRPPDEITH